MRAITVTEHGGPEVLTYGEAPDPVPGPGQVLVRTSAIGVNFIDTYFREGMYPTALPYIPGSEGSGTVVALGEGVTHRAVGDVVAWCEGPGSYAELVAVPADRTVVVPDGVAPGVAASVLLQGMTAHYLTHDSHPVQAGDTVLVHAGAGGTGLLVTQMATALGARVITTVSTDEKERLARGGRLAGAALRRGRRGPRAGADRRRGRRRRVRRRGQGHLRGLAARDAAQGHRRALRRGIRPGAAVRPAAAQPLGSLFVQRPTLAHHVATAEDFARRSGAVLDGLRDGSLRFTVGATYPLAEVGRAHTDLQARRTTGSVALLP